MDAAVIEEFRGLLADPTLCEEKARARVAAELGYLLKERFIQQLPSADTADIDEAIEAYEHALEVHKRVDAGCRKPMARYTILGNLAQAHYAKAVVRLRSDTRPIEQAVRLHGEAMRILPAGDPELVTALDLLASAVKALVQLGGDRRVLDDIAVICMGAVMGIPAGAAHDRDASVACARLLNLISWTGGKEGADGAAAKLELWAWMRACPRMTLTDPATRTAYYRVGELSLDAFHREGSRSYLDHAVDALDLAVMLGDVPAALGTAAPVGLGVGDLGLLGLALRLRFETADDIADLDRAISVFRGVVGARAGRKAPSDEEWAAAVGQLCDLLIQRFDHAGDLTDLDEVISLH
ncbi:hypothetical protein ABZ027_43005, partial [Streptomyces sp. NPDC006332]|uniref:hypothetical protein n=1 Tax=Streptomyces sp. NPDC006332 TaxID=3155456 RepID=UPI0033A15E36